MTQETDLPLVDPIKVTVQYGGRMGPKLMFEAKTFGQLQSIMKDIQRALFHVYIEKEIAKASQAAQDKDLPNPSENPALD